jgi:hypothetical protein
VADDGLAHGLIDAGVDGGGAGSEEVAHGSLKRTGWVGHRTQFIASGRLFSKKTP